MFYRALAALVSPLIDLLGREGKAGGVAAIGLGLVSVLAGVLAFGPLEGEYRPRMLALCGVGVVLLALGIGVLLGSQARVEAALGELEALGPVRHARPRAIARELAPPFWICGDCRCVEPGRSAIARCTRCGRVGGFFQVSVEGERGTAIELLP